MAELGYEPVGFASSAAALESVRAAAAAFRRGAVRRSDARDDRLRAGARDPPHPARHPDRADERLRDAGADRPRARESASRTCWPSRWQRVTSRAAWPTRCTTEPPADVVVAHAVRFAGRAVVIVMPGAPADAPLRSASHARSAWAARRRRPARPHKGRSSRRWRRLWARRRRSAPRGSGASLRPVAAGPPSRRKASSSTISDSGAAASADDASTTCQPSLSNHSTNSERVAWSVSSTSTLRAFAIASLRCDRWPRALSSRSGRLLRWNIVHAAMSAHADNDAAPALRFEIALAWSVSSMEALSCKPSRIGSRTSSRSTTIPRCANC